MVFIVNQKTTTFEINNFLPGKTHGQRLLEQLKPTSQVGYPSGSINRDEFKNKYECKNYTDRG